MLTVDYRDNYGRICESAVYDTLEDARESAKCMLELQYNRADITDEYGNVVHTVPSH